MDGFTLELDQWLQSSGSFVLSGVVMEPAAISILSLLIKFELSEQFLFEACAMYFPLLPSWLLNSQHPEDWSTLGTGWETCLNSGSYIDPAFPLYLRQRLRSQTEESSVKGQISVRNWEKLNYKKIMSLFVWKMGQRNRTGHSGYNNIISKRFGMLCKM